MIGFRLVHAMLVGVVLAIDLHVAQYLLRVCAGNEQPGYAVNDIDRQSEAIDLVLNGQIKGRVDISLFLVTAHMQVLVIRPSIGQPMDQPWIAVEGENNWFVLREQAVEVSVRQAVGGLSRVNEPVKVHYVHEADLEVGEVLTQQYYCGKSFLGGN